MPCQAKDENMKVLMITTDFPYASNSGTITQGGGGSCVAQLVKGLKKRKINVSVITREEKHMQKELMDVPIHRTKFVYLGFRESKITHSLFSLPAAISIVRKENPDIIHSHNPAAAITGIAVAKLFNKPHILTMHGPWSSVRLQNLTRALARKIEGFAVRNSIVTTCDSEALKKEMEILHKVKTIAIQNAVDNELFGQLTKRKAREKLGVKFNGKLVLFTGRFVAEKGLDSLLEAATAVLDRKNMVKFLLIGGGFDEHIVKNWIKHNPKYKNNIIVIPFLKHEMMNVAYNAADMFVLPSLAEGLSRSLMEAMVCGLPCIATDVGGNAELLSSDRGILVKPRNSRELASAIIRVISNEKFSNRLGSNAKQFAIKNLTVKKRIEAFLDVYKNMLTKGKK